MPTSISGNLSYSSLVEDRHLGFGWSRVTQNLGDKKFPLRKRGVGVRVVRLFLRQNLVRFSRSSAN